MWRPCLAELALKIPYGPSINTLVPAFNLASSDEESPNAFTVILNEVSDGEAESEYG